MKKLKVVTVVGTRPEIIRLSRLIPKLDEFTDHVLVHTGQNYDRQLNEVFFEDLDLRQPDYFLNVDTSSFGTVMGDTLKKSEAVFLKEKPDAVMILGDTNSAIAAVVAERMHIPVYHMEAGNRSFDSNVPEELNRKLVDHVSTFNLAYSERALANLLREGIGARFTMVSGSPMPEIFSFYSEKIRASKALETLGLEQNGYFLASLHRQENVDNPKRLLLALDNLEELASRTDTEVIIPAHPRLAMRLSNEFHARDRLRIIAPMGFTDYVNLQVNSLCVVSDSGSISEESAILGFKAITLRDSMERPEALDAGTIVMSGLDAFDLCDKWAFVSKRPILEAPSDYTSQDFSDRVVNFVLGTAKLSSFWSGRR